MDDTNFQVNEEEEYYLPRPEDLAEADQNGGMDVALGGDSSSIIQFPVPAEVDEIEDEDIIDYVVHYGDKDFVIEEPDTATVLRFLNFVGTLATRAEQFKAANFKAALKAAESGDYDLVRTELYSFAATLNPSDVVMLSAIVFFGGSKSAEAEGLEYFRNLRKLDEEEEMAARRAGRRKAQNQLRVAPLVQAVAYRLELSHDLQDALGNLRYVRRAFNRNKRK